MAVTDSMLRVRGLESGYGTSQVLQGVDIDLGHHQVAALLGRNGMGKTTLIHTLMGMLRPRAGSIVFGGKDIAGLAPHRIARAGIGLVPQGRRIFSRLSVEENLGIARGEAHSEDRLEELYELLPSLARRKHNRGNQLSGGEQQMLAIARAMAGRPRLMFLDEPSEGLAPLIVEDITSMIGDLKATGMSALLVEQNLRMVAELADVVYIMAKGRIAYAASIEDFKANAGIREELLGL